MSALPPHDFDAAAALAAPLQQSPQFAAALRAYGTSVSQTSVLSMRKRFGPLEMTFASRVAPDALAACPARDRPRVINGDVANPNAYRALGYRQILTPAHIAEWDLTVPDRLATMQGKWRNQLRLGQKSGLRLRMMKWAGQPHDMFGLADALALARGYQAYPTALLARYAALNAGDALIFEAYLRGHLCASCLVLRHGNTATYQTAWVSEDGRSVQASRVLLDHAADTLTKLGHTTFDLGTLDTDNAPGLARFKLGTGARLRPLGGTWLRLR